MINVCDIIAVSLPQKGHQMGNIIEIELNEVVSVLKRDGYENVKIIRDNDNFTLKALETYGTPNFDVRMKGNISFCGAEVIVSCLYPIPEEKLFFALQLINLCNVKEDNCRHTIDPNKYYIQLTVDFCLRQPVPSIGSLISSHSSDIIRDLCILHNVIIDNSVENVIKQKKLEEYLSEKSTIHKMKI
jgi:hypothetical protein